MYTPVPRVALLALSGILMSAADSTAQGSPIHGYIGQIANAFDETPTGQGLLPTALAEAEIAAEHAAFALSDPTNLDAIKLHVGHVLHAIEPGLAPGGPGLGYGVRQATENILLRLEVVAADTSATDNVRMHTGHILSSMGNVAQRADAIVALAQEIQALTSAATAASILGQLAAQTTALVHGRDVDRDGRVGWQAGEGGLRQATQHMTLMQRGEGLISQ